LFAGAAGEADAGADHVVLLARSIAAFAFAVFLVVVALLLGWRHHGFDGVEGDVVTAVCRRNAYALFVFQVAGFAEAADDAVLGASRARIGVGAGRGAGGTAFVEDFVFFALRDLGEHGDLRSFALVGWHAKAVSVSQESFLAEAPDDAVPRADRAGMGLGAVRGASRAAGVEFLVVGALREGSGLHEGLRGFALVGRHAKAVSVSQVSFLAETSDDAVLGASAAGSGVGAVGGASGAAFIEYLVGGASRDVVGQSQLHGGSGIAFVREHAFALSVLQVSLRAEATDDALKGTNFGLFLITSRAIGDAGGSAGLEFLVQTALDGFRGHGKSRSGDSGAKGANAEQQQKSRAKGHR